VINRHLYLVGTFTGYLIGLYKPPPQDLLNKFYPDAQAATADKPQAAAHLERGRIQKELDAITNNTGLNQKAQAEALIKFIEDYFVKPIAYLFFTIMVDQAEKWDSDMKGKREKYLSEKEFLTDGRYFLFTDRDLRRLFEFWDDPVITFDLNQYLSQYFPGETKEKELLLNEKITKEAKTAKESFEEAAKNLKNANGKLEKAKTDNDIKSAKEVVFMAENVMRQAFTKLQEAEKQAKDDKKNKGKEVEVVIREIKVELLKKYNEKKLTQPAFPFFRPR